MLSREEFSGFYSETNLKLYHYLLKLIENRELAEDFCQETYLKFLKLAPESLDKDKREAYLFSIGRRLFYDYLRRRKLFMNFQLVELRKKVKTHYEIETDFKESDLDFLLSLLNEKERDLLCLAYEEQKSHREIAEICGLKEKSVKVLLARYRTKLRRLAVEKKLELGDKYGRE